MNLPPLLSPLHTPPARLGLTALGALCLVGLSGCTSAEPAYPPPSYPPTYVSASYPSSDVEIYISSEADFIEPLSPYGEWVVVGSYGRCWRPRVVEVEWQPYANGHWVWTDQGWYWASDDPWGWATCHYGRWDRDDAGWFWVPQTQWSPAWVDWREGDGYIGWAPLPPRAQPRPRAYVFVEERRFSEPIRPQTVIVNNTTIINRTVNITNTRVVNNVTINQGPRREVIEQRTGRRMAPVAVQQVRVREEAKVKNRPRSGTATRESQPSTIRQPNGTTWRQPQPASAPSNQAVATPEQRRPIPGYRQPEPPSATGPARAAESDRVAAERAAQERRDRERLAAERAAQQQRAEIERAEKERVAHERAVAEQRQRAQEAEHERAAAAERAAKERERALAEQRQNQRDAQERAAAERERNERAVAEHAQRNRVPQQPASVQPLPQTAPSDNRNSPANDGRGGNPHQKKKVKQPNDNDRDDDKRRDQ